MSTVQMCCVTLHRGDHSVVHVGENWGTERCYSEASRVVRKRRGDFCSR